MNNFRSGELQSSAAQVNSQACHLSDEQFSGLLFGSVSAAAKSHLHVCSQCAEEAERVSSAIGSFERDSRLWAERQASAIPAIYPARQHIPAWMQLPAAWAVAAVALVIATTIGLPHFGARATSVGSGQESVTVASEQATAAPVPPSTLKADNELLSAIDGKLRANDTPPAEFYGLKVDEDLTSNKTSQGAED